MSDSPPPPPYEYRPPPPEPRSGCLTAMMVVVGIILLLPGLCALLFGAASLTDSSFRSDVGTFIVLGLLVGAVGVFVIVLAIRGHRL